MIPMPAIYVHETKQTPYASWIVRGDKVIETRTRNVLKKFVGFLQDFSFLLHV